MEDAETPEADSDSIGAVAGSDPATIALALAVAKFSEAEKYAPNWGRLHLKWGEALWFAGRGDDAKKQFALAATLDLSPADKSELARVSAHG